ncbi:MAG: TonB-dependent receptor [Fodinibius sp.]|nr:TonB-dependent receptor [Fodinibius sp.]
MVTRLSVLFVFLFLHTFSNPIQAQDASITGTVTNAESQQTLAGVNVGIQNLNKGAATNARGKYTISKLSGGQYTLTFSYIGFESRTVEITLSGAEQKTVDVALSPKAVSLDGIQVTALPPSLEVNANMKESEVEEANPRDSGELLRNIAGVDAVRRGPVGLDPVVRGLRETEVGTYLNGTRIFPGGPARMDSPLSHLDPSAIQSIEVVKGPYALTWGAGNMSAVKVETRPLNTLNEPFRGNFSSGYDTNYNAFEESVSLMGSGGKLGYWVHGAWREGSDYETGSGSIVQGDFMSREVRGKVGYQFSQASSANISLGYQDQQDIDYPGRLLNADYFHTTNISGEYNYEPESGALKSWTVKAYFNDVNHGMDNEGKPTALADPNRMPPFALNVQVDADMRVIGYRTAATFQTNNYWTFEVGSDFYSANRTALRTIDRRDEGMTPPMFPLVDAMWPQTTISDLGFFARAQRPLGDNWTASGTIRFDYAQADADTVSDFFAQNVTTNMKSSESNFSGSLTTNYSPTDHWSIGAGIGSVVRTADATERFSDRIPASKAQTSAEFVGNPQLDPERSTQADLWIDVAYPRFRSSLNIFGRVIDNYITVAPTNLPKRLPLSPNTVYTYENGRAKFWGFDLSTSYRFVPSLKYKASFSYLWGQDTKLNEPALGVSPLSAQTGVRFESQNLPLFMEGTLHLVDEQNRLATTRGETATDGYTTIDFLTGFTIWKKVSMQLGVNNLLDANYVNHLNAKNPFTGMAIAEPGRYFFADLNIRF